MEPTYQQRLINETLTIKAVNDTRIHDPYIGVPRDSKDIPEIPRDSKDIPEIPRDSQRFPEIPRDSKDIPEIPRDSQRFPEIPRDSYLWLGL